MIEIIVMVWEIKLNFKMRKYGMAGFEKITEEERRNRYTKKYSCCGLAGFILYLTLVVLAIIIMSPRSCESRHSLELGVCVECDKLCMDCQGDATKCNKCMMGYFPNPNDGDQCDKCDAYEDSIRCKSCSANSDGGATCNECAKGFVLDK